MFRSKGKRSSSTKTATSSKFNGPTHLSQTTKNISSTSHILSSTRSSSPNAQQKSTSTTNTRRSIQRLSTGSKASGSSIASRRTFATDAHQLSRAFRDRCVLQVTGGDGGDGCASYERTIFGVGGPNGGNGGRGGDVYFETDQNVSSFQLSRYHFKAGRGKSGGSDALHGSKGEDITIRIPPGTIIREVIGRDSITNKLKTRFLTDLNEPGQKVRVAVGAEGGYGNKAFKSSDRPKAGFTTVGQLAESRRFELELKVIADVGFVGFPNAGKSSLLRAISNAEPKVADYPFTTLTPEIGRVNFISDHYKPFLVADLPGLVDGAHMNVGLGHEFLRHIERTKILLYVIDIARPIKHMKTVQALREKHEEELRLRKAEIDKRKREEDAQLEAIIQRRREDMRRELRLRGVPESEFGHYNYHELFPNDLELEQLLTHKGTRRIYEGDYIERPRNVHVTDLGDPVEEFLALRKELALYQPELAARPAIVFANKVDKHPVACTNQLARLREAVPAHWPIFSGSAKQRQNLQPMLMTISHMLQFLEVEAQRQVAEAAAAQSTSDSDDGRGTGAM